MREELHGKHKIAVLTTHRANNYGAMLQSYALTHKINEMGKNCEILDYRCPSFESLYHSHLPLRLSKSYLARLIRRYGRDRETVAAFEEFRLKCLTISAEMYADKEQLNNIERVYDIFIVGSDQIWNPANTTGDVRTFDRTYFLDFIKDGRKKYSYAASIGLSTLSDELAAIYRKYLIDFSLITLREHKGAEIIKQVLNREAVAVCDPVLLLDQAEWRRVEKKVTGIAKDYILVYCVGGGRSLETYAKKLSEKENCAVYFIQPPVVGKVCSNSDHVLKGIGPSEFVWLIRNAKALITSSFHGSAFGLLFGKEVHLMLDNPTSKKERNSRIESLLIYFGIEESQMKRIPSEINPMVHIVPDSRNQRSIEEVRRFSLSVLGGIVDSSQF